MKVTVNECSDKIKVVGVVFISPYMIKKYGSAVALTKVLNRKKYKYIVK